LYEESIERLARTRIVVHHARAHLVYGEWLRRENRRLDAREHLRAAHDAFDSTGVTAFADRDRLELRSTGETAQRRSHTTRPALTTREMQIALLAARAVTNSEIGSQLFISPRTVEYHLKNVFTKLSISSRRELSTALRADESSAR
jgi:DNA-binding CsgD family transcriptional regulator